MRKCLKLLKRFFVKHDFPINLKLKDAEINYGKDLEGLPTKDSILVGANVLLKVSAGLLEVAELMAEEKNDYRFLRLNLIVEETAEVMKAMAELDEIELADGLADLSYVVIGTALTYGLPIDELFKEVHRSNMTKAVSEPRITDKGEDYLAPDIAGVLKRERGEHEPLSGS